MKFSLFAHLERISPEPTHAELYDEFIALCKMADDGGMHAIWTGEHHAMDLTIAPNPFLSLVDLAHHTQHVRLGTGTVVAPFWHPIKLAGEAAMTDIITQGRLDIGIARGSYTYEYERLMPGLDAWQAGQRLREMVPAIKALWAGDYAHEGEFYSFPATTSAPKPLQPQGPPLWIAARDPNSHEFAVANDCNVQVTPLWQGVEEVESLMQRFNAACDKQRDAALQTFSRPKIMLLQHVFVGATDAEVTTAADDLNRFYCHFGAWFRNDRPVRQGLIKQLSEEEIAGQDMFSPAGMRKNLVLGRPAEVVERLKHYEDLGYDEFAFWIDCGMSTAKKKASLARFIDEVMPAFSQT